MNFEMSFVEFMSYTH